MAAILFCSGLNVLKKKIRNLIQRTHLPYQQGILNVPLSHQCYSQQSEAQGLIKKSFPQDIKSLKNNNALWFEYYRPVYQTCLHMYKYYCDINLLFQRDIFHKITLEIWTAFVKQSPGFA